MALKPQVEVMKDRFHSRYGASRHGNDVTLFYETIRNGKLAWKKIGTAKWDSHHGLYAVSSPDAPIDELQAALRRGGFGRLDITKNFKRERLRSPASCAKGSFRTIKRGGVNITICCPRGKFKRGRCTVGTRAQSIARRR